MNKRYLPLFILHIGSGLTASRLDPVITEEMTLKLMGMVYYGDPVHIYEGWTEGNEIGRLWNRFESLSQKYSSIIKEYVVNPGLGYEIHISYPEAESKEYHIFVGVETKTPVGYPLELFYKELPSTKYAIFTSKGVDMAKDMALIYSDWLPNSKYNESYPMLIERYDAKRYFGLNNPESEIDFMLPIREVEPNDI